MYPGEDGLIPGPGLCAAGDAADQPGQRGGSHHRHLQQAGGGHSRPCVSVMLVYLYISISTYILSISTHIYIYIISIRGGGLPAEAGQCVLGSHRAVAQASAAQEEEKEDCASKQGSGNAKQC